MKMLVVVVWDWIDRRMWRMTWPKKGRGRQFAANVSFWLGWTLHHKIAPWAGVVWNEGWKRWVSR